MTRTITIGLGVPAFVLGVWGYRSAGLDWADTLYATIALFSISFDRPGATLPLALQWARFLAVGALISAILWLVISIAGRRVVVHRARSKKSTVLLLGSGRELVPMATSLRWRSRSQWMIVVADAELATATRLRRLGRVVILSPGETANDQVALITRANEIYVLGASDSESLALARAVKDATEGSRFPTRVLFDNPDVTSLWNAEQDDHRGGVSRSTLIATQVLRVAPARPEEAIAPPSIIVGDGPVAAEVLRGTVRGWQQPGEIVHVDCLGTDRAWVDSGLADLHLRAEASWTAVPPNAGSVVREVERLRDRWVRPSRVDKVTEKGPSIVVAFEDDTVTATMAERLAHSFRDARVAAVVDRCSDWQEANATHENLVLVGSHDVLVDLDCLLRSRIDCLTEEIVAELGRWPDQIGGLVRIRVNQKAVARLEDQDERTFTFARGVAQNLPAILKAGQIELARSRRIESPPIFCNPTQLTRMAEAVSDLIPPDSWMTFPSIPAGLDAEPGTLNEEAPATPERPVALANLRQEWALRLLEFVARLPVLAARAGYNPHRSDSVTDDLSTGQILALARGIHEGYLQTAEETKNASDSVNARREWAALDLLDQNSNLAQVYDAPVKIAMAGRTWQRATAPALHGFTDAEVEFLAELEHRRWHHFQIRTGRRGHEWATEWRHLGENLKKYDRDTVRALPSRLAAFGLEIQPATVAAAPAIQPAADSVPAPSQA